MGSTELPAEIAARLRELPSVDEVIEVLDARNLRSGRANAAREAIDSMRVRIRSGGDGATFEEVVEFATNLLEAAERRLIRPVINATGVLIHTNLGRVPLGDRQIEEIGNAVRSYTNLEYDLDEGARGDRYGHATEMLKRLTGAEGAVVVNNNAAAVMLVLSSLCAGRDVILSRGELVEIGGEFRIPEVMRTSQARLLEVGTTNRTHLGDYERAISPETAALMKVHASNYKIVGFTKSVDRRELARLARGRGVLFIEDLGSGMVVEHEKLAWARNEPSVAASVDSADIVTFSGDKLLGGPQAGIIVGRGELITRIKMNPLLRALRVDKMTLGALQATLAAYLDGTWTSLPFWKMALQDSDVVEARARAVIAELEALVAVVAKIEVVPTQAVMGGGSVPGEELASWALSIVHPERGATELHAALRQGDPPVIARIEDDRVLLDMRTVADVAVPVVATRLATLVGG
jgi:L-seryl-tRNA(Ser) seleniumtransferase